MREIKFRGKNYGGIWLYGYLMPAEKPVINKGCKYRISVSPQSCAGKDKMVYYEGDIMNDPTTKGVGVVEWNSVLCQFQLSWQNMPTAADIFFMVKCGSFVIGNIHDNPEMRKGGAE